MIDFGVLFESFNLAFRQQLAIDRANYYINSVVTNPGMAFKRISLIFLTIIEMFGSVVSDNPLTIISDAPLDLTGYSLVFEDEFNGNSLDMDIWENRGSGATRNSYFEDGHNEVKDGNLYMRCHYKENGSYGAGWYHTNLTLKEKYTRGYFEIRAKVNSVQGFDSCFWLSADGCYEQSSNGGINGCEIDIMEHMNWGKSSAVNRNSVSHSIHCNGGDNNPDKIESRNLGSYKVDDVYNEYNTYGLKWTEDEYIFYINGKETIRTSYNKGVSIVPEEVVLSITCKDACLKADKNAVPEYTIDYVRIYQLEK